MTIASLQYEHLALQERIRAQKESIDSLHHAHNKDQERINQSEASLLKLEKQQEQLTLNLFKQTKSYQTISSVQAYNLKNIRDPKVLTEKQQAELMDTLLDLFREPIHHLKQTYPRLTYSNIVFYYLEQMQYDTSAIAACFGKIETNSIHQRKHRLKERMKENEEISEIQ